AAAASAPRARGSRPATGSSPRAHRPSRAARLRRRPPRARSRSCGTCCARASAPWRRSPSPGRASPRARRGGSTWPAASPPTPGSPSSGHRLPRSSVPRRIRERRDVLIEGDRIVADDAGTQVAGEGVLAPVPFDVLLGHAEVPGDHVGRDVAPRREPVTGQRDLDGGAETTLLHASPATPVPGRMSMQNRAALARAATSRVCLTSKGLTCITRRAYRGGRQPAPADARPQPARDHTAMAKPRTPTGRRRITREPQYVMRVNILLTQEQFVKLQAWARDEGRPLPNLIRRLIDLGIWQRT